VNTVGAMQYTSKQFHIRIMKKFKQHFTIAIIRQLRQSFEPILNRLSFILLDHLRGAVWRTALHLLL